MGGFLKRDELTQHQSAHLLLHRCEVFRCRRTGLGKVALPVITGGEHPVDHAALEVDTRLLDMAGPL